MTHSPNTLRFGDVGADVTVLQTRLQRAGMDIVLNGFFDEPTAAAVRAYQRVHGLVVDGVAGPRTITALTVGRDPLALTQRDIDGAAADLECDPAALQAVIEIESPYGGFTADGRVTILFERHVFWRQLVERGIEPASLGLPESILSQKRGGYIGGTAEWSRLFKAREVNAGAAYASCSWGRFQIMGYHAASLGYDDAYGMSLAFDAGEAEHLSAFVRFIRLDSELQKALRTRKWPTFARIYNGPAYADNMYDTKLARAYARHSAAAA